MFLLEDSTMARSYFGTQERARSRVTWLQLKRVIVIQHIRSFGCRVKLEPNASPHHQMDRYSLIFFYWLPQLALICSASGAFKIWWQHAQGHGIMVIYMWWSSGLIVMVKWLARRTASIEPWVFETWPWQKFLDCSCSRWHNLWATL